MESKTLWMGDVQYNWDEPFVTSLFAASGKRMCLANAFLVGESMTNVLDVSGEVPDVKLIRDRVSGYNAGYGFIEFASADAAKNCLNMFNGQPIRKKY